MYTCCCVFMYIENNNCATWQLLMCSAGTFTIHRPESYCYSICSFKTKLSLPVFIQFQCHFDPLGSAFKPPEVSVHDCKDLNFGVWFCCFSFFKPSFE